MTTRKQKAARSRISKPVSRAAVNKRSSDRPVGGKSQRRTRGSSTKGEPDVGTVAATAGGRRSKKASILTLLQRRDGASIGELTEATGWQVHSVRAALTRLRKTGHEIVRTKDDADITRYRDAAAR